MLSMQPQGISTSSWGADNADRLHSVLRTKAKLRASRVRAN